MMPKSNKVSQNMDFDDVSSEYSDSDSESEYDYLDYRISDEEIDPDISYEEFCERYGDCVPGCVSEKVFKDFWWYRRWEDEDELSFSQNSSYLHPWKHERFGPGRTINYDYCKPGELKRFVIERGLKDPVPGGVTLKYCYIRLLDEADKKFSFRLMDLPPEMRLMVYRDLLILPARPGKKTASLGLLRTSKQVYEEARGVLYDDNVFSVEFEVKGMNHGSLQKLATVHNDYSTVSCSHARYFRIPAGIDDYPEFFHRIAHLEIKLRYVIEGTEAVLADGPFPLNHFLYTLASFLMDGHRLKSLRLDVDLAPSIEEWNYQTIFYPLRRLRSVPKVTITGNIPANVRTILTHDLKSIEPTFNTLRHWKLLDDEAQIQMKLLQEVTPSPDCECGECYTSECIEELDHRLELLDYAKDDSVLGSRSEEDFIGRLSMLRNTLRTLDAARIKRLANTLIAKRAATNAYKKDTDKVRLEEAVAIWDDGFDLVQMTDGAGNDDWDYVQTMAISKNPSASKADSSTSISFTA